MIDHYEDDEVFRDINSFYKRLMERMFREMEDFERAIGSKPVNSQWDVKSINKPGVRGYVARGGFQFGTKPLIFPKGAVKEQREPFTDVFDKEENVKIYMELPGADKGDIKLNVAEGLAEVKAKSFFKTVKLPAGNLDFEKVVANYKNGVLEVIIPKIKKAVKEEEKRTIEIE